MRAGAAGWRSARLRPGGGAASEVAHLPPLPGSGAPGGEVAVAGAGSRRRGPAPAVAAPVWGFPRVEQSFQWPWQGVDFSLSYVAFLIYIFVISSYVVNLGQVAIGTAIIGLTIGGKDRWKIPVPMMFLYAFLVMIAITYHSTAYRNYVWTPLQDITKVFLIATVGVSVLTSRARLRFFMFFYLGVFALFPVRGGVFNWFIYNAATQGRVAWNNLFENPNDYAALMIFPLGLCLAVFVAERSKLIKQASFLGLAAIPMLIFMTQSRGAILALAAGVGAYFMLQGSGRMKSVIAIGAIAVVVYVFAPKDVWTRMANLRSATQSGNLQSADDSRSAEQRFEIWRVAWSVHKAFPITGVGWAAYPNAHADYARRTGIAVLARGARDAHNTYLTLLGETGWIGIMLWSGMLAAMVTSAIRAMQRMKEFVPEYAMQIKLLLLALFAYGVCGVFGSFAHMSFTYIHIATIIAMTSIAHGEIDAFRQGPRRMRSS